MAIADVSASGKPTIYPDYFVKTHDLVGPTRRNHQWQAREPKGFDADHFLVDWEKQQAPLNLVRSMARFEGLARAQTRRSAFARLYDVA